MPKDYKTEIGAAPTLKKHEKNLQSLGIIFSNLKRSRFFINNELFLAVCLHLLYSSALLHAIETVVIEWSHQIRDVLKQESAQPLLEGLNPGPAVEIEFWQAKCANLQCIYDQVRKKFCSIF